MRHYVKPSDEVIYSRPWRPHGQHALALTDHLEAIMVPFIVGLAAGLALALYLHLGKLRWTWAVWGAPLAYIVWQFDWEAGLLIATATAVGGFGSAYWHFQDTERGGEAARAARERVGVWHVLRSGLARRRTEVSRLREVRTKAHGRSAYEDRLALGINRRGAVREVAFGSERGVHALVLGATGSGKTVTQATIAQAYAMAGLPVIVLDPKGDAFLRRVLQGAASSTGMAFREWSPSMRTIYNPFGRGNPTEIADKALAGHRWTEPHYELATQRLLGQVLGTMRAANVWPPTLSGIVRYMDPESLDALAARVGGETGARVSEYVDGLSAKARADLGGGRDRLAVLADGELGPRLDPKLGDGPQINFERALSQKEVVYFHIDADRYPAASKLLGAALVIDLVTLVAQMQGSNMRGLLVIDEFAALAADQVSRLFGRARSAGLSVLLGTQGLADLRTARPEDPTDSLTEQVLTNIEFAVVHREADPDSAERLARLAGTRPSWTTTEKVGGHKENWWDKREGTRTPDREFIVMPDEIKRLQTGEAVVIDPTAKTPAEVVKVLAPVGYGAR